jgi:hypothetical protein
VDLSKLLDNFGGNDNSRMKGTLNKDLKKLEVMKEPPKKITRKE